MIRWLDPVDVKHVGSVLGLARLYQGTGDYLVDWHDGEPTGHAYVAWSEPPELQDLEVRGDFQRRGIASRLIAAAEEVCRRHGSPVLHVTVSHVNDGARSLYEGLGYREARIPPRRVTGAIEIRTGWIEVDDLLVTLEKQLGDVGRAD